MDDVCDELMFDVAVMLEEFVTLLILLMTLLSVLFEESSSGRLFKKLINSESLVLSLLLGGSWFILTEPPPSKYEGFAVLVDETDEPLLFRWSPILERHELFCTRQRQKVR